MHRFSQCRGVLYLSTLFAALALPIGVTHAASLSAHRGHKPLTNGRSLTESAAAMMRAQAPLVAAADRIKHLQTSHLAIKNSGLGGIELEVAHRTVRVWWKGQVPSVLRRQISRLRRDGIKIELRSARFSQRELLQAARMLVAQRDAYPGLQRLGPLPDGSGLEAGVATTDASGPAISALPRLAVPVRVVAEPGIAQAQASRANDIPPWWAGAVFRSLGSSTSCSSGFVLARHFLGIQTSRGILTAQHCAGFGTAWADGGGQLVGTHEPAAGHAQSARFSDSLYIGAFSAARTYIGNPASSASLGVAGATTNFPGFFVCTSGAATGQHCTIRTISINNVVFLPSGMMVEAVAFAAAPAGFTAAGPGDSGGPVFRVGSDPTRVFAAGMIVGTAGSAAACPLPGQTGCTSGVLFVDIGYLQVAHRASLVTSP